MKRLTIENRVVFSLWSQFMLPQMVDLPFFAFLATQKTIVAEITIYFNYGWKFLISSLFLIVLAMESQAEALGQLTSDELDGKVDIVSFDCFVSILKRTME